MLLQIVLKGKEANDRHQIKVRAKHWAFKSEPVHLNFSTDILKATQEIVNMNPITSISSQRN